MTALDLPHEIELKFQVEDADTLAALALGDPWLGSHRLSQPRTVEAIDIYWDTPAYDLTRRGFGLRTRWQASAWIVTLKALSTGSADGLADRLEVEEALAADRLATFAHSPTLGHLLKPLGVDTALLTAGTRAPVKAQARVQPFALIAQRREKRDLLAEDDQVVGELSADMVQIYTPERISPQMLPTVPTMLDSVSPLHTLYELELEATENALVSQLETLAQRLQPHDSVHPARAGKLERALQLLASQPAITATTPLDHAVRLIWKRELLQLLLHERGVRQQDADAVHDMRVATRRMRAAYRLLDESHKKPVRRFMKRIRQTATRLGRVRDLDVALERLVQSLDVATTPVAEAWQAQRFEAHRDLTAWLDSKTYRRFLKGFAHFCHTQEAAPPSPQPALVEVRHVVPALIVAQYAQMRAFEAQINETTTPELLHRLRIEGKRLRYSLEFFGHLLEPQATATLVSKLKALQDCLGTLNDAVFFQHHLEEGILEEGILVEGPDRQLLDDRGTAIIERQRAAFIPLWQSFIDHETRQQLALAVVYL